MQVKKLELTQAQIDLVIAQARAEAPLEACGLLGGKDGRVLKIYPAVNELASPTRYALRPQDLLAALQDMEARGGASILWESIIPILTAQKPLRQRI